jgi:hypothetical protein
VRPLSLLDRKLPQYLDVTTPAVQNPGAGVPTAPPRLANLGQSVKKREGDEPTNRTVISSYAFPRSDLYESPLRCMALPLMASTANEQTVQNLKGTVTYGPSASPTTPLAVNSSRQLDVSYHVATGADSKASITLPDSSKILMASGSEVQLTKFDVGADKIPSVVVALNAGSKVRFTVEHPNGAKADYSFSTATGQIAVRGTEGDINFPGPGQLQVNVYALSNPAFPVQVTLVNGQVFTLAAGQALVVTTAATSIVGTVTALSHTMFTPFAELGAPVNASGLGIAGAGAGGAAGGAGAAAGGAAAGGVATGAAVAGVAAVGAATAVVTSNSKNPTPAPTASSQPTQPPSSPTPQPSTTSVPIVISGKPEHTPAPGAPPVAGPPAIGPQAAGAGHPGARPSPRP